MAQNEELEFLRAVATRKQQDECEQPAGNEVDERAKHRQPPQDGERGRYPGTSATETPGTDRASRQN
jgi:hypothetical protein